MMKVVAQAHNELMRILTFKEACEYLGMKKATLYGYVQSGVIPAFKSEGSRVWKFDVHDLNAWIDNQKQRGSNA